MERNNSILPSGQNICCSFPDLLFLPELIFGGLVWILVACTYIDPANPQAYVMAVSLFCFVVTFLWLIVFFCGSHQNKPSWFTADVIYHAFASLLYLSASVLLASTTIEFGKNSTVVTQVYKLDISAVVFSFAATLLYTIHTAMSAVRWTDK